MITHRRFVSFVAALLALVACGRADRPAASAAPTPTTSELRLLGEQMFPIASNGAYIECAMNNARHGVPPFDYVACPVTASFRARLAREQVMLVAAQNPSTTRAISVRAAPGGGRVRVDLYTGSPSTIHVDLDVALESGHWLVADVEHKGGLDGVPGPSPLPLSLPAVEDTNRQKAALGQVSDPAPSPTAIVPGPPIEKLLRVPSYRQAMELSCEEAALRMALAWENIAVTDLQVIDYIGIDHTPATHDRGGALRWGDPYTHFLGDPNGSEVSMTGYGTYFPTIAAAATHFGGHVLRSGEGVSPATIYDAVLHGHPSVAWVTYNWVSATRQDFIATDGRRVPYAGPIEHAVTVVGVRPDSVWVNNPLSGLERISKTVFEATYGTFNDMAVILD